jgi:cytochrome P450
MLLAHKEKPMSEVTVTGNDARYDDMFRIEKEAEVLGTGVINDPHPIWAELLARGPVHRGSLSECMGLPPERAGNLYTPGVMYYSVFSFDAVSDVFTRKEDFSSESYVDMGLPQQFGDTILNMDGLRHRRYRSLIQEYFQPPAASSWWREKIIVPLVDQIIETFAKDSKVDLNSQFFARLPMHTVTAAFGMSPGDGLEFRHHMQRAVAHGSTPAASGEAMKAAGRILESIIRSRQEEPKDDIISKLAHAKLEEDGDRVRNLTVEEIASFCRLIVFAGGGTTWRQLGITTYALLSNPDQLETVMGDRSLLQSAILESARWYPTDPLFPRKVIRDTSLHSVELPKSAVLHLCLSAANRDPSRWQNPDKYDVHRPMQRSVAFAAGHHSCLGQHVARQEMAVALNALFDRFPNLRWDPSMPPANLMGGLLQRGPGPLHVLLN